MRGGKLFSVFQVVAAGNVALYINIAANPPGFPGNLPDFETSRIFKKIPDFEVCAKIKKEKRGDHFFDFVRDCGN